MTAVHACVISWYSHLSVLADFGKSWNKAISLEKSSENIYGVLEF